MTITPGTTRVRIVGQHVEHSGLVLFRDWNRSGWWIVRLDHVGVARGEDGRIIGDNLVSVPEGQLRVIGEAA